MARKRSGFGNVRKLPSGRWQARYTTPGTTRAVTAPTTFDTRMDAQAWLATIRADLVRGAWLPPDTDTTLREYAATWLAHRTLKPRTREHYAAELDQLILPSLGATPLRRLTPTLVREWHARTALDTPTARAHAYALLRTICGTAVTDDLIPANPCRIRGAGQARRASRTTLLTLDELQTAVDATPDRYQVMVLLAAWCGLRYGELAELRGRDVDTRAGVVKVRRALVWVGGEPLVSTPKSSAGSRDVTIPPHLLPAVRAHLLRHGCGSDGLLFPSPTDPARHIRPMTLHRIFRRARTAAGRPDCRFHDLRHFAASQALSVGATLTETMQRMGHSTVSAAMRYQHAAAGRDAEIAKALSKLADTRT